MYHLISDFTQHLSQAVDTIQSTKFKACSQKIDNVLITGLGGSGIGGTITSELVAPICKVPVYVNKDYHIPAFVGNNTLVIACSYSGNTEETLCALALAEEKNAQIACISSGGKLKALAKEKGYNCISMMGGNPPRSMLAFSFTYLLHYFNFYKLAEQDVTSQIEASIQLLNSHHNAIKNEAEVLAKKLQNTTPHILAVSGTLGVAARWRQQFNENSKMLCWEAEVPEMNHNELVGWEGGSSNFSALFLRNNTDFDRNQKRVEIIKGIISEKTDHVYEVWSKGNSAIEKALYLINFGDWVSYYLSELNQVDILDIKSIDLLKSELGKIPF